jgi:uncharacterized protein with von Willebrand factor type A (vWA) domain
LQVGDNREVEAPILRFVGALRAAGVRVSPPEAADALAATVATGVDDRDTFRAALRSTLVKRDLDLEAFDRLFPLHFDPFGSHDADVPDLPRDELDLSQLPPDALDALGAELAELLDRLLASTDLELAMLVREAGRDTLAALETLLQQGMATRTILEALAAGGGADAALDRFAAALRAAGFAEDDVRRWRDRLRDELDRLRATVRGTVREELTRVEADRRRERRASQQRRTSLGEVPLGEVAEMTRLVERLGRKLDSLPELRRAASHRGILDMQRTWRANLQTGGIPFRLRWERRRVRKPQVVALCDISNSMQSTVRFLLHFLYRLQDRFSRVRTFVFVSDTVEVTQEFAESSLDTALERALQPQGLAYFSSTNYGRSFDRFLATYPDAVSSRSIVIVCGDGRGNYTPPRADLLDAVRRRARRLVWFNPESRLSWGIGDSSMPQYLPFCTQVAEVRTLAQLEAAIDAMVAGQQAVSSG